MNTKAMITMLVSLAMILTTPLVTLGEKPPDAGNGGGGGGGGEPPDYGDLIILYRDADGVPILTNETDKCQQPLAAPGVTLPAVGTILECVPESATESCVIPVDPATCAVVLGYETYTQEVDFGRINEARSSEEVFASQLQDVVVNLATADCITLDPAGRLVTSTVVTDPSDSQLQNQSIDKQLMLGFGGQLAAGEEADTGVLTATIDSPLQNLAIYRQLMEKGFLGDETNSITLPGTVLDTAARAVGAGSGKSGEVNVDLVAYLNQIMGLTDPATTTVLDKICIEVKEEVTGTPQMVEKCFLDYGAYEYDRTSNFESLPSPPYIPTETSYGWFEYLAEIDPQEDPPLFQILQGPIMAAVFDDVPFEGDNIGGFAQAADDARAVIDFMHTWPMPGNFVTPVACPDSGVTGYDVSISEESGLQVPVQMAANTEGREFTVTVANAGPDAATGTVTVTTSPESGYATVDLDLETSGIQSQFIFYITEELPLLPGQSRAWTRLFSATSDQADTINWTAEVLADFDVYEDNNSVTATTKVRVTGGGGGGH